MKIKRQFVPYIDQIYQLESKFLNRTLVAIRFQLAEYPF